MSGLGLCLTLSVGLTIGLLFAIDPSLDLQVARFFHALDSSGWAGVTLFIIREFNLYLIVGLIIFCTVTLAVQVRQAWTTPFPSTRACALVLLVIAVGPGLIVNAVLKEHWSRPRPGVILASGDETSFRAWWDPTGNCPRNCSFASGEASAAFATLAIAVVSPIALRYTAITIALLYGLLISATRVAAGGHFVSDVVFAGVISALVVWTLHGLIYRWPATRVSDEDMRAWLAASALRLRHQIVALPQTLRRIVFGLMVRKPADVPDGAPTSPQSSRASA